MNQKIKAVVFDAGGVIDDWQTPCRKYFKKFGCELETILKETEEVIIRSELGEMTMDEFCQELMAKIGLADKWRELRKIMPREFIPHRQVLDLIKELKLNYRLALLTNAQKGSVDALDALWNIKQYFEVIIDSSVVKIRKPDVRIFKILLKQMALTPQECLYIDDMNIIIAVAKKLGFRTILFIEPSRSVNEIRKVLEIE